MIAKIAANRTVKFSDHGTDDISQISLDFVDVDKYKNYTYTPRN